LTFARLSINGISCAATLRFEDEGEVELMKKAIVQLLDQRKLRVDSKKQLIADVCSLCVGNLSTAFHRTI
jgi:hypothetical protein